MSFKSKLLEEFFQRFSISGAAVSDEKKLFLLLTKKTQCFNPSIYFLGSFPLTTNWGTMTPSRSKKKVEYFEDISLREPILRVIQQLNSILYFIQKHLANKI